MRGFAWNVLVGFCEAILVVLSILAVLVLIPAVLVYLAFNEAWNRL